MNHNYNAHHSPIGAFASFTLGFRGPKGGLGLELGGPADQNIYVGCETEPGVFELLPFFDAAAGDEEAARYDVEGAVQESHGIKDEALAPVRLSAVRAENIYRELGLVTDAWQTPAFSFVIHSPVLPIPDPKTADAEELKATIVPAVLCELTVDNSKGTTPRRAVFGFTGSDPYTGMRRLEDAGGPVGIGQGRGLAIASADPGTIAAIGFSLPDILGERLPANHGFGLGVCSLLIGEVAPGETKTFRYAVCFHRSGFATAGLDMSYLYTESFPAIEDVASYATENFGALKTKWTGAADKFETSHLSPNQRWMFNHAVRSYYGSTQLLQHKGEPIWVVGEGEYRMMNTFDLTVDHLFWELRQNPWVVRNALDQFVDRYSYQDTVRFPGDETEYPGGISFTHDMGTTNIWSRPGHSSYEKAGLHGCFSHMTHEQLTNWILCASVYAHQTKDGEWLAGKLPTLESCFQSLLNRDHPDPKQRRGIMQLDSSRCAGGSEITTYDSLDVSLGQARNNGYLAGKIWASYVAIEKIFRAAGKTELADLAHEQSLRSAATLVGSATANGTLPAVLETGNVSRIIPAIEGLVFPYFTGSPEALDPSGEYGRLIHTLAMHLRGVLRPGQCLFHDGGWKLSSTSDNSWLSKIYLCQFVARHILGFVWDDHGHKADAAHVQWLLDERNAYYCWSDQILAGVAVGSKYYPRGVTSGLWLLEGH